MTKRIRVNSSGLEDQPELTEEEERLFTAISFNKVHKVPALLSQIKNVDIVNQNSHTPLLHSALMARGEQLTYLVRILLKKGCDVNAQDDTGKTPLMHVILRDGPVDALRPMMRCKRFDPDVCDKDGNTALMYAAEVGNAEAVAILLFLPTASRRADVHARNRAGRTALDFAVEAHQVLCCQMLVEEGKADTDNVKDKDLFHTLYHIGL